MSKAIREILMSRKSRSGIGLLAVVVSTAEAGSPWFGK